MRRWHTPIAMTVLVLVFAVVAQSSAQVTPPHAAALNGLRGSTVLDAEPPAPLMPKPVNDDVRRTRAFAMQPPVIPHHIDNYQLDANFNKCMSCHARENAQQSQAPMVSVTHFTGRDGNVRSEISPRRYFCTQCHAAQLDVKPPVANSFLDARQLPLAAPSAAVKKK